MNPDQLPTYCSVEGCQKEALAKGLCAAHYRRQERGKDLSSPLREYGLSSTERLVKAAIRFANAEGDQEYERAQDLLSKYSHGHAGRQRVTTAVKAAVRDMLLRQKRTEQFQENENVQNLDKTPNQG